MLFRIAASAALAILLTPGALATEPPKPPPVPVTQPPAPQPPDPSAQTEPGGVVRAFLEDYFAKLEAWNANPDGQMDESVGLSAVADRLFTDELAARVKAALKAQDQAGEITFIDFDPFICGQDFQNLKVVTIDVQTDGDASKVSATIENMGTPCTNVYSMAKTAKGWRVEDLDTGEGGRMTDWLKAAGF